MATIPSVQSRSEATRLCRVLRDILHEWQRWEREYVNTENEKDGEGGAFDYAGFHGDFKQRGKLSLH